MGRQTRGRETGIASRSLATTLLGTMLGLSAASLAPARAADLCSPSSEDPPARVASITDRFDIRLDDGRTLRLAGVDVTLPTPDTAAIAQRALVAWVGAGPVAVKVLAAGPDRWGRLPALVFRPGGAGPSAAESLLDAGLARAKPDPAVHPCFAAFLDAEDRARAAKRGLWAAPGAAPLRADDTDALARASGGFVLVEGILQVHAARGGTLYLTFGHDRWGFAAVLMRRDAARFAKVGLAVADYVGTPVRLRGDLDDRFGARMPVTDPDQFQSLEPGTLDAAPERER